MSQLPVKHVNGLAAAAQVHSYHPAAHAAPLDVATLYRAFRRRWPLALGGGLLLAAAVAALSWAAVPPAKYVAVGTIHVKMIRPKILPGPTAELDTEYSILQRTQMAMIKSPSVLDAVVLDPEVAGLETIKEVVAQQLDPGEWLEKQVVAEFENRSEVLKVSMSGDRPGDVAVIANKIIDKYMKIVVDSDGTSRKDRIEKLQSLRDQKLAALKEKRANVRNLTAETGSGDPNTISIKGQLAHELLNQTETERMKNRYDLNALSVDIAALEGEAATAVGKPEAAVGRAVTNHVPDHVLNEYLDADPNAAKLAEQVTKAENHFNLTRNAARLLSDPAVVRARSQQQAAYKALSGYKEKLRASLARRPALPGGPAPAGGNRADTGAELAQLKRKAAVRKQYDEVLTKDVARLRDDIHKLNDNTQDLQTEMEEITTIAATTQKVAALIEEMEVEKEAPKRIIPTNKARTPRTRDEFKKVKVSGGAAAGAFACVLLGVTLWEARSRRVNNPDEVVKGLGIRLVGSLPAPQAGARRRLAAGGRPQGGHWQSVMVESVDATRTMLLHAARGDALRVVMVTSAVAGEGKTTLACHLTASLARAGLKTILIDCDLRRPAAHRLFDQAAGPGVSELLRGEVDLDGVIRPTQAQGLDLIPAGLCDTTAVRAVAQGGLQPVFDVLRSRYDFVIVDSAPVLPVVDSLIISQHTDAVLFSILRDVSRISSVEDARDRLSALGVRILGAVVSGMSGQSYSARYGDVVAEPKAAPAAAAQAQSS